MPVHSAQGPSAWQRATQRLREELFAAPLAPVLHPSPLRMKGLGVFMLVAHPLLWFVWALWLPQPYESLPLRAAAAALGLLLASARVSSNASGKFAGQVFSAVCWLELSLFTSWMFYCNGASAVWLAGAAAAILVYYAVTDWRLATLGLASGASVARVLFELAGPEMAPLPTEAVFTAVMVLGLCVAMGILLGMSSANLRREQLAQTLATMRVMAHELRTPLATMALVGDAVRGSGSDTNAEGEQRLKLLAARLQTLVRNMNHQVDMQIANARLQRLPGHKELVLASNLVQHAVSEFPFRSTRERECVQVRVSGDFRFQGSPPLFRQLLDNLLKNALRSLASTRNSPQAGDLVVEVHRRDGRGFIVVADRGVGIDPALQQRIFEPFFSTDRSTGLGLGLAFSESVVRTCGGSLSVRSEPGHGAAFTVELPVRN